MLATPDISGIGFEQLWSAEIFILTSYFSSAKIKACESELTNFVQQRLS